MIAFAMMLGSCTGGGDTGSLATPSGMSSTKKVERVTKEAPPPAQMQVGTVFAQGALARYCEGTRCDVDERAKPPSHLEATSQGLLLFVVKRPPASARVEIFKEPSDRSVMHRALHTGSLTLAVHEDLAPGTYQVRLSTAWHGHEALWLFGLKVPTTRA